MRKDKGWIKLHKSLLDSDIMQNDTLFKIWITLLLRVNWKEHKAIINGKHVILEPGSMVFGFKKLAESIVINKKTLVRWVRYLSETGRISLKTGPKGSVLTICNWDVYQANNEKDGPLDGPQHGPPDGQRHGHYRRYIRIEDIKDTQFVAETDCPPDPPEGGGVLLDSASKKPPKGFEEAKTNLMGRAAVRGVSAEVAALHDEAYSLYPKKIGKQRGYKLMATKFKTVESAKNLVHAVKNYSALVKKEKRDKAYIKQFDSFMSNWEDYLNIEQEEIKNLVSEIDVSKLTFRG